MLHGFSSCTLRPAIAMMSLIIAGRHRSGCEPAATPASLPSGMASVPAGEGVFYCYSSRSVFPPTAAPELTIIGVIPLLPLARLYEPSQPAARHDARAARRRGRISSVLTKRAQLALPSARCCLPSATQRCCRCRQFVTERAGTLLIAAGIVLPQLVAAAPSPALGQLSEAKGGGSAFPDPAMMVVIQSIRPFPALLSVSMHLW
jgi:hypothetical protein